MSYQANIKQLFFLLLLAISCQSFAQTIYLPHYTTKNGLPSNNCFFTLQDKKGYIWIATDAGVSRFDGAVFENFSIDDGLPDNQILQLKEDSKGRIWFLSLNGQLSYFLNGRIYNSHNNTGLKQLNFNAVVVSFHEDKKGNIWFGTNQNIIGVWNGKSLQKFQSANPYKKFINAYLTEDEQGTIWALTTFGNFKFSANKFHLTSDQILSLSYKTIQQNNNGSIYFLSKKGLYLKEKNDIKLKSALNLNLLDNNPGYIYVKDKELWLTNNNGVFIIDDRGVSQHFLKDVDVSQVIKDSNNNMWFTSKNGIYRLPEEKERMYVKNSGLSNNTIKSLTKDANQQIWLGLANGKINVFNLENKNVRAIDIPDKTTFNNIKQLTIDKKNNLLYFASDYGLGAFSTQSLNPTISYLRETNNFMFVIKNFCLDTTANLALSLSSGVVILNDRHNLKFSSLDYKENQDFFANRSYRVYYDNQQNLWFANIYGLSQFGTNGWVKHYAKSSLLTKRINDIKQLNGDTIVLATDGYGLMLFHKNKIIKQITTKNGLNNNIINKLFVRDKYLWTISNTGINRIDFKHKDMPVSTFDYTNELLADDLNDLYIDKDTAFFATNNGLVYFLHNQNAINKNQLKVYISSILNNKSLIDLSLNNFNLPPGEHNLVFNYSAVDFKNSNISYRYRLKENSSWTETQNRRLELSSLPPGEYCFEVQAKAQGTNWSNAAKIHFILEEHFWQTWWFLGLIIVFGAYILYRVTVNITRQQKNKEQEQLLLKNKILMLEQKALQAMMNPHFVFNVMNSIQHYINTKNTTSANKVLTGFAKLIRKNLDIITKSNITLEEEISYLSLYLSLEKYRFGEKLNYSIVINKDIDQSEIMVPSMLLQPFIENAIWHGIMPQEAGGHVSVNFQIENHDYLRIQIIDDGIGIENALKLKNNSHESKGMLLTKDRITLLNQIEAKPIQYHVQQNGNNGTTVTIAIPI